MTNQKAGVLIKTAIGRIICNVLKTTINHSLCLCLDGAHLEGIRTFRKCCESIFISPTLQGDCRIFILPLKQLKSTLESPLHCSHRANCLYSHSGVLHYAKIQTLRRSPCGGQVVYRLLEAPYRQKKITLQVWVCGGILHPCPGCSQQTFSDCGAGRALSAGSVLGCSGFLQGCSKSRREESGSEDLTEELWLLPTLQAWLMVLWGHGLLPAKKHKQRRYFRKTYSKRKNYHYSNALLQR